MGKVYGFASATTVPAPDAPPPAQHQHNLPAPGTRVVGRGAVIDALVQAVRPARLVSIVGPGGIGKTTLALAVAERSLDAFPDGVWLVDFAALRDPELVPHAIASAIGLTVHSGHILTALCRFMRTRELLLVLDNCEHLVAAIIPCVQQILHTAPGVRILATSRAALRIAEEQVHKLAGLAAPPQAAGLTATQALEYPAIELFVARATDRLPAFVLRDRDAAAVADICRGLDGIALAIELAAMRIDVFGVKGLQQQLGDRFRLLGGRRAGLERHRTLLATLDWSYGLLPDAEAALLRAIAVFPGAFSAAGAASVAALAPEAAAAGLAELAAKSLLSLETGAGATTYRLLETTRAYCLDRLVRAGEERTLRARHADHACAVVQQAAAEWERRPSRDWGAAYGGLLGDLRAALAWAGAEPGQVTLQIGLTTAGTVLWNHFSLTDESRTHLAQAIAGLGAAGVIGTKVEMHLQFALAGAILYTRGMTGQARDAVYRALALSEHLGDTDFRLRCLRLAATFELFSGQHDAGIRTLDAFFAIASAEDPTAMAEGETHQCVGAMFIGRVPNARTRMERLAERAAQDFNDARFARFQYSNSINMLVVLSHAQWLTGQAGRAAQTAGTIDAYGRAADHELSLSIALAWNSLLYFWLGRADDCSHHAMLLDELVERHGIVTWRPIATFCRGALAVLRQPDSADGLADLERAIVQFRATGHLARLPFYLAILADTYGKQGRFEQAGATIDEAVAVAASQNEQWCLPELLRIQSGIATAQGEHAAAESLLVQSIALAQRTGTLAWQLRAAMDLAKLWHVQARTVEARAVLQSACAAFTEDADNAELRAATTLLTALQ